MVTSTYIRTYMHMIYLDFPVLLGVRHEKQPRFAHFSAPTSDIANRIDYSTPYERRWFNVLSRRKILFVRSSRTLPVASTAAVVIREFCNTAESIVRRGRMMPCGGQQQQKITRITLSQIKHLPPKRVRCGNNSSGFHYDSFVF